MQYIYIYAHALYIIKALFVYVESVQYIKISLYEHVTDRDYNIYKGLGTFYSLYV